MFLTMQPLPEKVIVCVAAMAACAAAGGTWDSVNRTCIPSGFSEDEGMGAGMWLLLILLGAATGYGIWYIATDGK
jgi:tripartite-type tricarboxylate transporter receptor subunit TctC